jgi:hypothetical protein
VTDRVSDPPGPFAVNVYVVVAVGNTWREPLLCTAPTPWSMDMSVALLMDQLKVDDWPRSMVDGSAAKILISGFATVGATVGVVVVGGGGGGGAFFLQPWIKTMLISASSVAANREACILWLAVILNGLLFFKSTEFLCTKPALYYCLVW